MVYWRKKLYRIIKVVRKYKRLALGEIWGYKLGGICVGGKLMENT